MLFRSERRFIFSFFMFALSFRLCVMIFGLSFVKGDSLLRELYEDENRLLFDNEFVFILHIGSPDKVNSSLLTGDCILISDG